MKDRWHVIVEHKGVTYPILVGIADQGAAESAAVRAVGGGIVLTSGPLPVANAARFRLQDGHVVVARWDDRDR